MGIQHLNQHRVLAPSPYDICSVNLTLSKAHFDSGGGLCATLSWHRIFQWGTSYLKITKHIRKLMELDVPRTPYHMPW
jgi:hypothetical protein